MLTRDEQLRVKAAQFGDGEGKPARGRGRGRGCKATKQNNTKQSKKQGSAAKPASSGGADAWEPEWEETEWGEDDWARWEAGEWDEAWDEPGDWNEGDWDEWEKDETASKPKARGKRNREQPKAVAPTREPEAAPTKSRSKPMGRARPGDHASVHAIDEADTFSYPRTFARRAKPPIKGSDAEKLWMAITKGFLQEIDPFLESRTRTEAEAGTTHESMCCDNRCLKYHIYMNEPKHFWAGLGRPTTTCMPELAGPRVELPLEIPTSRSLCR